MESLVFLNDSYDFSGFCFQCLCGSTAMEAGILLKSTKKRMAEKKEEIAFFIGKESQLPGNRLSKVGYIILEKMVSYISIKDVMQ